MAFTVFFAVAASVAAAVLGVGAFVRKPKALASGLFLAGMLLIAVESFWGKRLIETTDPSKAASFLTEILVIKAFLPGVWLCFSLIYCRGDRFEFIRRWKWVLGAAFLAPVGVAMVDYGELVSTVALGDGSKRALQLGGTAKVLACLLVVLNILTLVNLEKTFRAAVGNTRWRIKYLFIGTGVIFGAKFYTLSQLLLFSGYNVALTAVDCVAVVIGCGLMVLGYSRSGPGELSIYPSRAVLQGSFTFVIAAGYLLTVGLLAQVASALGGAGSFVVQTIIILLGGVGLLVLLLSERFRNGMQYWIARHFRRPQHDFRKVWTQFTRGNSSVLGRVALCDTSSKLISETFSTLTVTVFISQGGSNEIVRVASTFERSSEIEPKPISLTDELVAGWLANGRAFDLDRYDESWSSEIKAESPVQFERKGGRLAVPLVGGNRLMGLMILADRANRMPFTSEELDLLNCLSDQLGAGLLNEFLTEELMAAKELEAFQTMSTFFVHDLKNAANSMNLMLQNLPVHFDDPEFRTDALRGIGKTVGRINHLIAKLSTLRESLSISAEIVDVGRLVRQVVDHLKLELPGVDLVVESDSNTEVRADAEQLRSVLVNLIVNAGEAVDGDGTVSVQVRRLADRLKISIGDNGCGMTADFVRTFLFRPFRSTKSRGLGIGVFQCKRIIEAHQGSIQVESEPGRGTIFHLTIPVAPTLVQVS